MQPPHSIILLSLLLLVACNVKPSYDVRVVNETASPIQVYFSSLYAVGDTLEVVRLEPGQNSIIIKTPVLEPDGDPCSQVAFKVIGTRISDGQPSKIKWCGDSISLEKVDIGQYQYLVSYAEDDF